MNRKIWVLIFMLLASNAFAQQKKISQAQKRDILLNKAQEQKSTGLIFIGIGSILIVGSFVKVIAAGPGGKGPPPTPVIPLSLGAGALLGGSILLGSGIKNEKEALEISAYLNFQTVPGLNYSAVNLKYYPAFTLKVNLK